MLDWPASLAPQSSYFELSPKPAAYVDPATGRALRQRRANPQWVAQFAFSDMCPDKWKALAARLTSLDGPVETVRLFDFARQGPADLADVSGFSDGTDFDDGTGFEGAASGVVVSVAAAKGAKQITIIAARPLSLPDGAMIGLPTDRLHLLDGARSFGIGSPVTFNLANALQEAVPVGAAVALYRPLGRFYVANADTLSRDVALFGAGTVTFVEEVRE